MLDKLLSTLRGIIPNFLFRLGQPTYHYTLALIAALIYRFPSREIKIVMITGTKGKTTTAEIINSILEAAGYKTALSSTIRTKIGSENLPNLYKMTTPGRFFLQKFLSNAVSEKCEWAVIEMTSQAVAQSRHKFIHFDTLIYTGIHPEHIEAHGSFEKYLDAKLTLAKTRPKIIVANLDDKYGQNFLDYGQEKIGYRLSEFDYQTKLLGDFNKLNVLAVAKCARALGVPEEKIRSAVAKFEGVPGRVEFVKNNLGIDVVVDYAHTPGSLEALYQTFSQNLVPSSKYLIAVLGACGGGRDRWKRPEFGRIANQYCDHIILTNEDPYDENPWRIVEEIETGITDKTKYEVEMDRRKAIARALSLAVALPRGRSSDGGPTSVPMVLITGKGTDPYIMGPKGSKLPWSDKRVAEEELAKLRRD